MLIKYWVFHPACRVVGEFTETCVVGFFPSEVEFQPVNTSLVPFEYWTVDCTPTVAICPALYQPLPVGEPVGEIMAT